MERFDWRCCNLQEPQCQLRDAVPVFWNLIKILGIISEPGCLFYFTLVNSKVRNFDKKIALRCLCRFYVTCEIHRETTHTSLQETRVRGSNIQ